MLSPRRVASRSGTGSRGSSTGIDPGCRHWRCARRPRSVSGRRSEECACELGAAPQHREI
eukprot:1050629-Rhodomonas_salina.1